MKDTLLYALIVGIIIALLLTVLPGCSHSTIVKDCKQVQDEEYFKCKTLKPWE